MHLQKPREGVTGKRVPPITQAVRPPPRWSMSLQTSYCWMRRDAHEGGSVPVLIQLFTHAPPSPSSHSAAKLKKKNAERGNHTRVPAEGTRASLGPRCQQFKARAGFPRKRSTCRCARGPEPVPERELLDRGCWRGKKKKKMGIPITQPPGPGKERACAFGSPPRIPAAPPQSPGARRKVQLRGLPGAQAELPESPEEPERPGARGERGPGLWRRMQTFARARAVLPARRQDPRVSRSASPHLHGVYRVHDRVLQDPGHRSGCHVGGHGGAGRQVLVVLRPGVLAAAASAAAAAISAVPIHSAPHCLAPHAAAAPKLHPPAPRGAREAAGGGQGGGWGRQTSLLKEGPTSPGLRRLTPWRAGWGGAKGPDAPIAGQEEAGRGRAIGSRPAGTRLPV